MPITLEQVTLFFFLITGFPIVIYVKKIEILTKIDFEITIVIFMIAGFIIYIQVYSLKVEGIAFRFLPDPIQIKNALEVSV